MIGNFGTCEVFSFHATKFFNSFEGGAVVTNSDALADKIRLMRNFGFAGFDNVVYPGTNGKMVEVCAAMGLTNLEYIDTVIAANRRNYNAYRRGIGSISDLSVFSYDDFERNNYQYVVMEVGERFPASRGEIVAALHAENILARKYFWPGCHGMELYRKFFPHANLMLANTEKVANRVIVLPTGTSVNADDIELIVDLLRCLSGDNR